MSRYYASIQGERGEATRQGHRTISGHIRGWNLGVRVDGYSVDDSDAFDVFLTSGSNGGYTLLLGTVMIVDGRPEIQLQDGAEENVTHETRTA